MTPFPFSILTPAGTLLDGEAVLVGMRSIEGALGVMAKHAPMVAVCPPGVVRVQRTEGWNYYATDAAILSADGHKVVVLAGRAEEARDEASALQTLQRWQEQAAE